MANTIFGNLKIGALRRAGNSYNANDTALLALAGGLINDCLGAIQTIIKTSPYVFDLDNTVATVASQAYVALMDTDIIEVLQVYQRETGTKLKQLNRVDYVGVSPDTTRISGTPDLAWAPTQAVSGSGSNIWSLYLYPTPSSVITLRYDYIKNLRFSADTGVDASFSPLPNIYDDWIYEKFKPRFWKIVDKNNRSLIDGALKDEALADNKYGLDIKSQADRIKQVGSMRGDYPDPRYGLVATTAAP